MPRKTRTNSTDLSLWNPNTAGSGDGIFGLPFTESQASLVLLNAPFEATTSYLGGTSKAPKSIFEASQQVDLFHPDYPQVWRKGIFARPIDREILSWNRLAKKFVEQYRKNPRLASKLKAINTIGTQINHKLYRETKDLIQQGKIVGLIGGDHSTPFGAIQAHLEAYPQLGILHIDAHHDLRKSYEGFEWSHASIFFNVIEKLPLQKLTQVGIRDFCDEEDTYVRKNRKIQVYRDRDIARRQNAAESWSDIASEIVSSLPEEVYISFDIDGLEPALCPSTGTPVPGGLTYHNILGLFEKIRESKRKLVGFDLVEVGPNEWDSNVAARLIYEMSLLSLMTR